MTTGILWAEVSTTLAETIPETAAASEYANVTVPAVNIILEGACIVLLLGVIVAGIILLRNHVREWLFPFGIGLVFNLVFQYMLFNQRFGLLILGFGWLHANVPFLKDQLTLLNIVLTVLEIGCAILTVILGMGYWKKSVSRDGRKMSLGGAIAFGFSFYVVSLFCTGYLLEFYNMISQSRLINASGFDAVLKSVLDAAGDLTAAEQARYTEALLSLADSSPKIFIQGLLQCFCLVFEGMAPLAASVLHYGVLSGKLEHKWHIAGIALHVLVFLPALVVYILDGFDGFIYVNLGYTLVLALVSVFVVIYVSKTYMPDEWKALGYTRKKQKKDEEREKNKIPKIVMPND